MSETPGREKGRARKIYSRPAVKKVHLKPEEAVLGGCKTANTKGPAHARCNTPTPCAAITS
jgi:hypothetical protein